MYLFDPRFTFRSTVQPVNEQPYDQQILYHNQSRHTPSISQEGDEFNQPNSFSLACSSFEDSQQRSENNYTFAPQGHNISTAANYHRNLDHQDRIELDLRRQLSMKNAEIIELRQQINSREQQRDSAAAKARATKAETNSSTDYTFKGRAHMSMQAWDRFTNTSNGQTLLFPARHEPQNYQSALQSLRSLRVMYEDSQAALLRAETELQLCKEFDSLDNVDAAIIERLRLPKLPQIVDQALLTQRGRYNLMVSAAQDTVRDLLYEHQRRNHPHALISQKTAFAKKYYQLGQVASKPLNSKNQIVNRNKHMSNGLPSYTSGIVKGQSIVATYKTTSMLGKRSSDAIAHKYENRARKRSKMSATEDLLDSFALSLFCGWNQDSNLN